jgi:hypothetical protein
MILRVSDDPFDHNAECTFCDEQGMHRADCPWLLQVLQEHAMWSAGVEDAAREIDRLRDQLDAAEADLAKKNAALAEIADEPAHGPAAVTIARGALGWE